MVVRRDTCRDCSSATLANLSVIIAASAALSICAWRPTTAQVPDAYLWLEEVEGTRALEWVQARNDRSLAILTDFPEFQDIFDRSLAIYDSDQRIPTPDIQGAYLYNFWQDAEHTRGIWRRTTVSSYRSQAPRWEVVLDIDSLSRVEVENWVWKGADCLHPDHDLCMVALSRGGADAVVLREFDASARSFVENGFVVPEAKSSTAWIDDNTLFVSTDMGEGSLTTSGYPRGVHIWQRGTPLEASRRIFQGEFGDVAVSPSVIHTPERPYAIVTRSVTFYENVYHVVEGGRLVELEVPRDAQLEGFFKNQMLLRMRSDFRIGTRIWPQGSLIGIDFDRLIDGRNDFRLILDPGERSTIRSVSTTWDFVLVNRLTDVRSELIRYRFLGGGWRGEPVDVPQVGTINVATVDEESNAFFFTHSGFLAPSSLYHATSGGDDITQIKRLPDYFDAGPYVVEQLDATSEDGTRVPYFVVRHRAAERNGLNPTLLYGYGGFEIPNLPRYDPTLGAAWLERGGVYVSANIRGGGEFGPAWHQAATLKNRQRAYDDFIAVAEDLIARQITSPRHLGIMGGSNGGLLVGVALTQRPDLFNAVVARVPLLDMRRYHLLLAGASWMAEYGNPDDAGDWDFISEYSPYHNVSADRNYPVPFLSTSTRDDRVHPAHARKMVAKMEEMGHRVFYYENMEGGHAAAANNYQRAFGSALIYSYLLMQLRNVVP